jgi:DNA-directed RNA polymerase specialized sigma subunit
MRYKFEKNRSGDENGKRKRIRAVEDAVDFMRVEDAGQMPGLDPFEREVKKEMASLSRSPAEELEDHEAAVSARATARNSFRHLRRFIRNTGLTKRQRLVYELCFVCNLPNREVAGLLDIAPMTVRRFRQILYLVVARALSKRREYQTILQKSRYARLTQKQKLFLKLYFAEGLSAGQIAERLGKGRRSVERVIQRVREKIFSL